MESNQIYRFRYYIKGISPLIWRRVFLKGSHTLDDLHHTIQMSFNWTNYHLHEIDIRGKTYGTCSNFMAHAENSALVSIDSLQLRVNERFSYEYNFTDDWRVEVRLENILKSATQKFYPYCIAGNRAGPPEDCGGPNAYMELDEYYSDYKIMEIISNRLEEIKENGEDIDCLRGTLNELKYWVNRSDFDRKEANVLLKKFANRAPDWESYMDEVLYL